jgi:hypothetical protein
MEEGDSKKGGVWSLRELWEDSWKETEETKKAGMGASRV